MHRADETGVITFFVVVVVDAVLRLTANPLYRVAPRGVATVFAFAARRATTRRFVCGAEYTVVFVTARAVLPAFLRGTTRRDDVALFSGFVFTTISIGLVDCDTVTPGFRSVRI